jgi:hypothetical protein
MNKVEGKEIKINTKRETFLKSSKDSKHVDEHEFHPENE